MGIGELGRSGAVAWRAGGPGPPGELTRSAAHRFPSHSTYPPASATRSGSQGRAAPGPAGVDGRERCATIPKVGGSVADAHPHIPAGVLAPLHRAVELPLALKAA